MTATSPLSPLLKVISHGIASIEAGCAARGVSYPSLDTPLTPQSLAIQESFVTEALPVIAAAHQLMATLMNPRSFFNTLLFGSLQSVALGIAEAGHVAEILKEAGPEGKSAADIAKHTALDPQKLAHYLRFLSGLHVFKEVSPDHFVNNRVSALLDTGKPVSEIVAHPEAKYDGAPGLASLAAANSDEYLRAASYAVETSSNPRTSRSPDPSSSPLNIAFGTSADLFGWYELPQNASRMRRFANAAGSLHWTSPALGGFDWSTLPKGGLVVDVGGGTGEMVTELARSYKNLRYICQDQPQVIDQAKKIWHENGDVLNGTVQFHEHDYFTPQPIKNADAFILRFTLHDWSDPYSIKILKHLRDAATPKTKLIVIDAVLPYNCHSTGEWDDIPGGEQPTSPAPLLPNLGVASSDITYIDLLLLQVTNTTQRTVGELAHVLEESGWNLDCIHRFAPPAFPQSVASPA
ncbi:hypothetical protein EIP91_007517 [Steccherinum ochraceum]|uniref:O-methyltransferase C-terminal domain-containing protein n=1 Tax=Steccherinum ochraceum TaxID=92696 RepID=A0A4R0REG9_9APHY|nr:hypothetical protein EIP91_007517 [Steccherinum ochraceum]